MITAIGYGLVNFLTTIGAKHISPLLAIWFPWVVFTCICIIWLAARGGLTGALRHIHTNRRLILTIGILDTLAWILFAFAVEKRELAVTIAITESYPAISLLLGIVVNKERISKYQIVGVTATIAASFIMGMVA